MNKKERLKKIGIELGIVFLTLLLIYLASQNIFSQQGNICIVKEKIGILCPSCGATRCVEALAKGNVKQALFYHPIFTCLIFYLCFVNLIYIINIFKEKHIMEWIYPKTKFWIIFCIILIIFTIARNIIG